MKKTTKRKKSEAVSTTTMPVPGTPGPTRVKAMERQAMANRRFEEQDFKRRLRAFDDSVQAWESGREGARGGRRALGASETDGRPALRIIAEGDSWFDYPCEGGSVITRLSTLIPYPILDRLPKRGDETRGMLGVQQRRMLKELLEDSGRDFNVMLFSGGGNDIVGECFRLWLRERDAVNGDPKQAINDVAFGSALNVVRVAYEDLLDLRDRMVKNTPGRKITVFLHGYDWALPDGRGILWFGPWLRPSLEDRGWDNFTHARAIVKEALTRFALMLDDVARQYPDVVVVKTQGLLRDSEWHNELHPNRAGFQRVGEAFRDAMKSAFPGAFR